MSIKPGETMKRVVSNVLFLYIVIAFLMLSYDGSLLRFKNFLSSQVVSYVERQNMKKEKLLQERTFERALPDPAWVEAKLAFMEGRSINHDVVRQRVEGSALNGVKQLPPLNLGRDSP